MPISDQLFQSILAIDAYNRGYNPSIVLNRDAHGTSTLGLDSSVLVDSSTNRHDESISFFAQAYTWNGKTVISHRGTDDPIVHANTGLGLGAGSSGSPQSLMAVEFYRTLNDGSFAAS